MSTAYEVTYRNMWPSESLQERIRAQASTLRAGDVDACRAWFDRPADDGKLSLRIELVSHGASHELRRTLGARTNHEAVCEVIDNLFDQLRREIGLPPALHLV